MRLWDPFALIVSLRLAACGGSVSSAAAPAPTKTAGQAAPLSDEWAGLSWEERHDEMTFAVLPNMARVFQKFHGSPAPEMTCRSVGIA